jgi:hypothetical protein
MDARSSIHGVDTAKVPLGDPAERLSKWLSNPSVAGSDPALSEALQTALDKQAPVQGVGVKIGIPKPRSSGPIQIQVDSWPKK